MSFDLLFKCLPYTLLARNHTTMRSKWPIAIRSTIIGLLTIAGSIAALHAAPLAPKPDPNFFLELLKKKNYQELDSVLSAYGAAYERASDHESEAVNAFQSFARSNPELDCKPPLKSVHP